MKNAIAKPALLLIAALLAACGSQPSTTSLLDQTRYDYQSAQNNPKVARYASLEMKQAGDALAKADVAAANNDSLEDIDKLAYLAKQKVALAQEVTKQKSAEAEISKSGQARDQMRLAQRTNEADQAKMSAARANSAADAARGDAAFAEARAATLAAQLADLSARKTERGMVITFGDVLFATDQSRLNPEGQRIAQKLAEVLQQNPQRTVLIEGFADSTGTAAYNQGLSERRASAVQLSLRGLGIANNRIAIHGYGESYPVASNATEQDRQLNRRVEIVLSEETGKIAPR